MSDQTLRTTASGRRLALRRHAAVSLGVLAAAGLGYLGLRSAGAFPVDAIRVTGAGGSTARAVLAATDASAGGRSLLAVDPTRLAAALQSLPEVQRAHVDRDFPHTLRVSIVPERPVATARISGRLVVVGASGRIMSLRSRTPALPSLATPGGLMGAEGGYVALAGVRRELAVAAAIRRFPVAVETISATNDGLVAATADGAEIRLGDESALASKLEIAGRILRSLSADARSRVRYVEVSAPAFPAVMANTPDAATAGLVPEDGVQIPSLSDASGSGPDGAARPDAPGVRSGLPRDPHAVVNDLFGHTG